MNTNTNTYITEIEIRESGKLTQEYKRRLAIKHTKAILRIVGAATAVQLTKLGKWTANEIELTVRPVRLDLFDHMYGTNLRAQYFSGLRTQQILKAKRQHGLA